MKLRRLVLIVASAAAFLVGYGAAAQAWPGVPDRGEYRGYFNDGFDDGGHHVILNGYPSWVDSAGEFINFTKDRLYNGSTRDRTGAAFLIQTMIGDPWYRNRPPNGEQMAIWESLVWRAGNNHWIGWNNWYTYTYNSYWQGVTYAGGDEPNYNDDAFYYEGGTRRSITFRDDAGRIVYVIKRDCANPLGDGFMPGLQELYNTRGWTTAPDTATPGQTVTFEHFVEIFGDTADRIYYATFEGASSAGTSLPTRTGSNIMTPPRTLNVADETFTIPNNAAAGSRYCRLIGWDPRNTWGGRDGRGAQECVTVEIPAKLKAAMAATPKPIAPGDTATFTPAISATSNASPITVQCQIQRTLYPPSGGSTSLGAQPCVTTGGDPNITIGPGASVTLRANTYVSADNIAVGTRVCDVITITNPSADAYYNNPAADRTATDCVTVAKSPYVHFTGGDVWAGGGFAAVAPGTCNNNADIRTVTRGRSLTADGTTPGSGTTYAAFALGRITTFGSGSMGQVTATGLGDNWTFANTNTANLGYFGAAQHCIPDYVATYQSAPLISGTNISVGGGGSGAWRVSGDANFVGATMAGGAQRVYFVNGNVTINNSITYPPALNSGLSSLVIIATGDIRVNSAVTQMDGIFISRGTFYTCYPKVEPATIGTCNGRLTVNGSVSANRVDLFRTGGADGTTPATQKSPAEVFNLAPEVYITNALNQTTQTTITTTQVRELPPRF